MEWVRWVLNGKVATGMSPPHPRGRKCWGGILLKTRPASVDGWVWNHGYLKSLGCRMSWKLSGSSPVLLMCMWRKWSPGDGWRSQGRYPFPTTTVRRPSGISYRYKPLKGVRAGSSGSHALPHPGLWMHLMKERSNQEAVRYPLGLDFVSVQEAIGGSCLWSNNRIQVTSELGKCIWHETFAVSNGKQKADFTCLLTITYYLDIRSSIGAHP